MRIFASLALLFSLALADFFVVSGDKKVEMTPLTTGKIDFSSFKDIASIERKNNELNAQGKEIAFNHRHLNFRLATIGLTQTNYSITEFSSKAEDASDTYEISFDNYTRDDGVMLQLFYKNRWYAVVLGDPLTILQDMFLSIDIDSEELDLDRAIESIKQARKAFPLDSKLKTVDMELENRRANEVFKSSKDSAPSDKPIKVFFK